jgi:hypothetical protein
MRKQLLTIASIGLLSLTTFAQTIVSTSPENRKVILEEFTGINCVFCPQGHAIAQAIQDANPGNVFLINIHTGGFANPGTGQPDYRTPFGSAIAAQSNLAGYPAGTVNRQVFPGQGQNPGSTAMSRSQWTSASNATLAQGSYVNVGVEAEVDVQTNEITVHVEAFYTGDSPEPVNKLNVALLQNNTLGPQVGGNAGNEYVHMHRLVWMLTGQWGDDVTTTTTGSFVDRTYTYTIPADYNGIPVELADLEVVAFLTETTQNIPSGSGAFPTYVNLANANDASLRDVRDIIDQCEETITPVVEIQNLGQNTLTTLDITYSVNGGTPEVYTWNGNLTALQYETIELPEIAYSMQATNTLSISLPNDDVNSNNNGTTTFDQAVEGTGNLILEVNTDGWGSEVRWQLLDSDDNILYNGGPYGNNQTITIEMEVAAGCYTFNLVDTYGDGGGPVSLTDIEGTVLFSTNGNYGTGVAANFGSDGVLGTADIPLTAVALYPNPASSQVTIANAEGASVAIYNVMGQLVYQTAGISNQETLEISSLQAGAYFVKLTVDGTSTTKRLLVSNR